MLNEPSRATVDMVDAEDETTCPDGSFNFADLVSQSSKSSPSQLKRKVPSRLPANGSRPRSSVRAAESSNQFVIQADACAGFNLASVAVAPQEMKEEQPTKQTTAKRANKTRLQQGSAEVCGTACWSTEVPSSLPSVFGWNAHFADRIRSAGLVHDSCPSSAELEGFFEFAGAGAAETAALALSAPSLSQRMNITIRCQSDWSPMKRQALSQNCSTSCIFGDIMNLVDDQVFNDETDLVEVTTQELLSAIGLRRCYLRESNDAGVDTSPSTSSSDSSSSSSTTSESDTFMSRSVSSTDNVNSPCIDAGDLQARLAGLFDKDGRLSRALGSIQAGWKVTCGPDGASFEQAAHELLYSRHSCKLELEVQRKTPSCNWCPPAVVRVVIYHRCHQIPPPPS